MRTLEEIRKLRNDQQRQWRFKNPERAKKIADEGRLRNKESLRARKKRDHARNMLNPEYVAKRANKRRAGRDVLNAKRRAAYIPKPPRPKKERPPKIKVPRKNALTPEKVAAQKERAKSRARDRYARGIGNIRSATKLWRRNNPEKLKAQRDAYRSRPEVVAALAFRTERDREKLLKRYKDHYKINKDKQSVAQVIDRKKNPEIYRERAKRYYQKALPLILASVAKRRARLRGARVEGANKGIIGTIFSASRRISRCTGIKFHVDHVVALKNGGAHHQNNLRVIPAKLNLRKGSRSISIEELIAQSSIQLN